MQNPDLGATRLIPLLKRKKITVSSSKIYRILKGHDLQTREKRQLFLKKQKTGSTSRSRKPPAEITPGIEEIIVDISLRHPDLGAKSLSPILNAKGIDTSVSTIYTILKKNNLQTREKRFAALEGQYGHAASAAQIRDEEISLLGEGEPIESFPKPPRINWDFMAEEWVEEDEIQFPSPEDPAAFDAENLPGKPEAPEEEEAQPLKGPPKELFEISAFDDRPEPVSKETAAATPAKDTGPKLPPKLLMATRTHEKSSGSIRWMLRLINLMLLVLIGYLGFVAVQNFRQARAEIETFAAISPQPAAKVAAKKSTANQPLQAYSSIWERNLFNVTVKETPKPEEEIPVEKIAPAKRNIGLQLVGTVFSGDATLSRAIVHVQKTKKEETFREGDQVDKVRIKKILRNRVIITTADGDQMLTINPEDFAKRQGGSSAARQSNRRLQASPGTGNVREPTGDVQSDVPPSPRVRTLSIKLKREQVGEALSDVNELLDELQISPYLQDGQPAGFIVSKIPRRSILTRMGLRNGYAVTRLNDQEITGADQAAQFFETLANGGDVSFQIQRSRGTRRRAREIQLSIE